MNTVVVSSTMPEGVGYKIETTVDYKKYIIKSLLTEKVNTLCVSFRVVCSKLAFDYIFLSVPAVSNVTGH